MSNAQAHDAVIKLGILHKHGSISVNEEVSESYQNKRRKEVGADEDILHKLKLEVVQKVRAALLVPDIDNHPLVIKSPVGRLVVLPDRPKFERVCIQKEQNSEVDLREENTFF